MRVFVTGASGFVGSAVVRELLDAGHQVLGLARSDTAAKAVEAAGAEVYRGTLGDLDGLRAAAAATDGVIHTAFDHDFSDHAGAVRTEMRAVETLVAALEGSDRPLVISSVIGLLTPSRLGTEEDAGDPASPSPHRIPAEQAVLGAAGRGVRSAVVRLPGSVHGAGDRAFVPRLIEIARTKGVSAYQGDGANRWGAVHRLDAARLFRLALEGAPAGSVLHGVGDEGIPLRDIATVIGRRLDVPVVSLTGAEAAGHFGWLARFITMDSPASSALTRDRLGWRPTRPGLLDDLAEEHYFTV